MFDVNQTSQVYENVYLFTAFFGAQKSLKRSTRGKRVNAQNVSKGLDILLTTQKRLIITLFCHFHGVGHFCDRQGTNKIVKNLISKRQG